ncbi:hypothetical protein Emag_000855 [Eimeria magna]
MRLWRRDAAAAAAAATAAAAAAAAATAPLLAWAHPAPAAEQQQQQQQQGLPVWVSKLLATAILVLVSAGGAALPVYLQRRAAAEETPQQEAETTSPRRRRKQSWVQVVLVFLNCFACGAFLGLGLLHLLPEAAQQLEDSGVSVQLSDGDHHHSYNSAYVLAAAGLTFMLFMDQLWGHAHAHGHSHGDSDLDLESVAAAADSAAAPAAALPHPAHLHAQQHGSCSEAAYCPECDDCVEANTAANEQDLGCSQRPPPAAAAAAGAISDAGGLQGQEDIAASDPAAHAAAAAAGAGIKGSAVVPSPPTHDGRRSSSSSSGSKNSRMLPCTSAQCAAAAAAEGGCGHSSCCSKGDPCVGGGLQGCCARSHSPDSELRVHCGLTGDKCQGGDSGPSGTHGFAAVNGAVETQGFSDEAYLLQKLQQQQQQQGGRGPGGGAAAKGGSKVPLAIALGTHALLEAMVVGATRSGADVWLSTLAILGHKGAEAVALASALLKAGGSVCCNFICFAAFVAATPIGVLVGSFVAQGGQAAAGVLNAVAVGIILYACIEMLAEFSVKASLSRRLLRCFAFLCGLGLLFGLDLLHAPVCHARHHHGHIHCDHVSPLPAAAAAAAAVSSHAADVHGTHSHNGLHLAAHHQHDRMHSNPSGPAAAHLSDAAAAAPPAAVVSGVPGSTLRGSSP